MGKSYTGDGVVKTLNYNETTDGTYRYTLVYGDTAGNCKKLVSTTQIPLGVTTEIPEAAENVGVRLLNSGGTFFVTAGDAVSYGVKLMTDNAGRAVTHDDNPAKYVLGIALEAATAAGDYIEFLPIQPTTVGV